MTLAYWCIFFAIFLPIFCAAYAKYRAGFPRPTATTRAPSWLAPKARPRAPMRHSKTATKSSRRLLPP